VEVYQRWYSFFDCWTATGCCKGSHQWTDHWEPI